MLHKGDLVIVKKRESYAVGDAVLYDSRSLDRGVLHRIKARDGNRLVMRGDNNDFDDDEKPVVSQVRGEYWFHVPKLGSFLAWFQNPLHAAILVVVLVLLAMGGGSQVARHRRASAAVPDSSRGASGPGAGDGAFFVIAGAVAVAMASGVLALLTVGKRQTMEVTVPRAYVHEGTFDWSARTESTVVYPSGRVGSGKPVFTRLVRNLDVRFAYNLASPRPAEARGRVSVSARLSDDAGWERVIPIVPSRPFAGRAAKVKGVLDLRRLDGLVQKMRELTGSPTTLFSVTLEPRVTVEGSVGETVVDDVFLPKKRLTLGTVALRPETTGGDAAVDVAGDPVAAPDAGMTVTESHDGIGTEPARLELGPLRSRCSARVSSASSSRCSWLRLPAPGCSGAPTGPSTTASRSSAAAGSSRRASASRPIAASPTWRRSSSSSSSPSTTTGSSSVPSRMGSRCTPSTMA
ncbi:MAG: hypothetical protein FJW96_11840 [Actinobacteria bacterium]|nr:hypothetical protein [Actinomycetota bacterium]